MKVLVLEDNQDRINLFKQIFRNSNLLIVTNIDDFIREIRRDVFDRIYMDHDLGGGAFVPSENETTGYQAAKYMVEYDLQKEAEIIIHSMNPAGAEAMRNVLHKNEYNVQVIPFSELWSIMTLM